MDATEREHHETRRRALRMELASLDRLLGIEKPLFYLPDDILHPIDEQLLVKQFRVLHAPRPASPVRD